MRVERRFTARAMLVAVLAMTMVPVLGVTAAWAAAPTITSFTPTSGPVGTVVTITGSGFNDAPSQVSAVMFNTTAATQFTVNSNTQITATVPAGATDGPISATDSEGTGASATNFDVTPSPVPTITSFTPTNGNVGTVVTITGTGFTGASAVRFNGVAATAYTVNSDTQITATVPTGATTGPISVVTPGGTATSSTNFTVGQVVHARSLTLSLSRHLVARGTLGSDLQACEEGIDVDIQRRKNGRWRNVGGDVTNAQGRFRAAVADRPGRYRARVSEDTVGAGEVCSAAVSARARHRH